jgi:exopolyphosphatase/guanosine-5'-triphosphate,3'-diphosphate pyrophosphatase
MLYSELAELTLEERCIKFRLKPDRADVILPALKIYILALKAMEQNEINVPKIGLVDGVIYQLFLLNSTN